MDYKKIKAGNEATTRNLNDFDKETTNIYESLVILSKRADQISMELKKELWEKIEDFQSPSDNTVEEYHENREQIELAKYYEQLPKPTLMAVHEFLLDKLSSYYPQEDDTITKNKHTKNEK